MPSKIDMNENNFEKPISESDVAFSAVSSKGVVEPDPDTRTLLKFTSSRNLFLAKIGMQFLFLGVLFSLILLWKELNSTSFHDFTSKLDLIPYWSAVMIFLIFEKIVNGFFGFLFEGFFRGIAYLWDLAINCIAFMTIVVYYDNSSNDHQRIYPTLIKFAVALSIANSLVFIFTTLIKDNKRIYNWIAGLIMLTISNIVMIYASSVYFDTTYFSISNNLKIALIVFVSNAYLTVNSYFIVNMRTSKFFDDQDDAVYFGYFIDWLCFFWIDLFKRRSKRVQMPRLNQIQRNIELKQKKNQEEDN